MRINHKVDENWVPNLNELPPYKICRDSLTYLTRADWIESSVEFRTTNHLDIKHDDILKLRECDLQEEVLEEFEVNPRNAKQFLADTLNEADIRLATRARRLRRAPSDIEPHLWSKLKQVAPALTRLAWATRIPPSVVEFLVNPEVKLYPKTAPATCSLGQYSFTFRTSV